MNEISKSLMCLCMRNGAELWFEEDKIQGLKIVLSQSTISRFVKIGGEFVNTADIVGIFSPATMEGITRRKNGQWQCATHNWHAKNEHCDCGRRELKSFSQIMIDKKIYAKKP